MTSNSTKVAIHQPKVTDRQVYDSPAGGKRARASLGPYADLWFVSPNEIRALGNDLLRLADVLAAAQGVLDSRPSCSRCTKPADVTDGGTLLCAGHQLQEIGFTPSVDDMEPDTGRVVLPAIDARSVEREAGAA